METTPCAWASACWIPAPRTARSALGSAPTKTTRSCARFFSNGLSSGSNQQHFLGVQNGTLYFNIDPDGTGDHTIVGSTPVADGAWHHAAVVLDRDDTAKLYVDGVFEGEVDISDLAGVDLQTTSGALDIGQDGSSGFFVGQLDEIAIHDEALDQATINAIMTGGFATASASSFHVAHFTFEDDGNLLLDLTGTTNSSTTSATVDDPVQILLAEFLEDHVDVALWEFNESPMMRSQLVNSEGAQYPHTIEGSPQWIEESSDGYSLSFGGNDKVSFGDILDLEAREDRTIALWFRTDAPATTDMELYSNSSAANPDAIWLGIRDGRPYFGFDNSQERIWPILDPQGDAIAVNDDQWHHLAVTIDRSAGAVLYLDGVKVGSVSVSPLLEAAFLDGKRHHWRWFSGRDRRCPSLQRSANRNHGG